MSTEERIINNYLFDQLSIVERLDEAQRRGNYEQESEIIKNEITRKILQKDC